jgi:c-di-GMP-binding flagellar brake protein YcgR
MSKTALHDLSERISLMVSGSWLSLELISPAGQKIKYQCQYVGCINQRFVLVQSPDMQKYSNTLPFLKQGVKITLRGVIEGREGAVIAFSTQLIKNAHSPVPMLILTYPEQLEYLSLRKNPRLSTKLSAKVIVENNELDAIISDISKQGCQLVMAEKSISEVIEDAEVGIKLEDQTLLAESQLTGNIRSAKVRNHMLNIGVSFNEQSESRIAKLLTILLHTAK